MFSFPSSYIKLEEQAGDPTRVQLCYERAVADCYWSVDLWKAYVAFVMGLSPVVAVKVSTRATRNCLQSGDLWVSRLECMEKSRCSIDDVYQVWGQCTALTLSSPGDYLNVRRCVPLPLFLLPCFLFCLFVCMCVICTLCSRCIHLCAFAFVCLCVCVCMRDQIHLAFLQACRRGGEVAAEKGRTALQVACQSFDTYYKGWPDGKYTLQRYWAIVEEETLGDAAAADKVCVCVCARVKMCVFDDVQVCGDTLVGVGPD